MPDPKPSPPELETHTAMVAPPKLQVLAATPPPVSLEVVIAWLRKKAAIGVPIRISPLLAQRIAAELEEKLIDA